MGRERESRQDYIIFSCSFGVRLTQLFSTYFKVLEVLPSPPRKRRKGHSTTRDPLFCLSPGFFSPVRPKKRAHRARPFGFPPRSMAALQNATGQPASRLEEPCLSTTTLPLLAASNRRLSPLLSLDTPPSVQLSSSAGSLLDSAPPQVVRRMYTTLRQMLQGRQGVGAPPPIPVALQVYE